MKTTKKSKPDSELSKLKLSKLESVLNKTIADFSHTETTISEHLKELALEIQQLKTHRKALEEDFPKNIGEAIHSACSQALPEIILKAVGDAQKQFRDEVKDIIQEGQKFRNELEFSVTNAIKQLNLQSQVVRRQGMIVAGSIFLSAVITALVIGFLFPRFTNNHYSVSGHDLTSMMVGDIYFENRELWNKKQHDLFIQKLQEKLTKRFNKGEKL